MDFVEPWPAHGLFRTRCAVRNVIRLSRALISAGIVAWLLAAAFTNAAEKAAAAPLQRLRVSQNGRCLELASGQPFFWLGDTAWWIRRINRPDVNLYLESRRKHRFNVIQIHPGFDVENHAGKRPFTLDDSDFPNEAFWKETDYVVDRAGELGLYVAITPLWGQEFPKAFGDDADKARRLGHWLGERYGARSHVVWIVSGEYDSINRFKLPISAQQKTLISALADGLRTATGGKQLLTVHPGVALTSSTDFHDTSWLDFNMLQSGHLNDATDFRKTENHSLIARDYRLMPTKPVLDGEPIYEDIPDGIFVVKNIDAPRADAKTMRRKAYWAVFSGACGHTYGHNDIWGFFVPAFPGQILSHRTHPSGPGQRGHWKAALDAPGATHMRHLRALIEARPKERVPDQSLLAGDAATGLDYVAALRSSEGNWAMLYFPSGKPVKVAVGRLKGRRVAARWFDPANGEFSAVDGSPFDATGDRTFVPPKPNADRAADRVLVLDVQE